MTLRAVALVQILIRCIVTVLLLYSHVGVLAIAIGDCVGISLCLLFEIYFCKAKLGLVIKYHYRDKELINAESRSSEAKSKVFGAEPSLLKNLTRKSAKTRSISSTATFRSISKQIALITSRNATANF